MKQAFKITGYLPYIIITFVALFSIFSLFQNGFLPTHDGEYHLIRFYEFGRMLVTGHMFPRWAPGLNSGYGTPLFIFFYPLPNYIGSLFHAFGLSLADAFRYTLGVGYLLAAICCYLWLRRYVREIYAIAGTLIGALVPYWFVDIFVRGSVGEVLAIGFAFGVFASIAWQSRVWTALTIVGLILSHNIMAMIFLPVLLVYSLIQSPRMIRWIVLGVGMSAYFWVPALAEQHYVVGLNTVSFADHFPILVQLLIPSWGTGFSGPSFALDEMSYQIGIVPIMILIISTATLLVRRIRSDRHLVWFFLVVWLGSIMLMLPISIFLWSLLPFMPNIQYPWRLLSMSIPIVSFLSAFLLSGFNRMWAALIAVTVSFLVVFPYTKPVLYATRSDNYYLSRREFTDGTSSLGNSFGTRWMAWQANRPNERMEIVNGEGFVAMRREEATTYVGDARLITDAMVRVHVAYYPGWRVAIDGKDTPVKPDSMGMITVPVSKGDHVIGVYFSETPLRLAADALSILSLFWLSYSTILKRVYENRNRHNSS